MLATQHEQAHTPKVRILTIWLGANDAALPGSPQHLPLDVYSANLATLVRTVTSPASPYFSPVTKVVVIIAPPVSTAMWGEHRLAQGKDLDRDFEVTRTYAEAAKAVAKQEGVPAVDLWSACWAAVGEDQGRLGELLTDGLHLNEKAYGVRLSVVRLIGC